jgi:hypothetical protein
MYEYLFTLHHMYTVYVKFLLAVSTALVRLSRASLILSFQIAFRPSSKDTYRGKYKLKGLGHQIEFKYYDKNKYLWA